MSGDTSVRNGTAAAGRMADALLRGLGGEMAKLLMPPLGVDTTDAGQMGVNTPGFMQLPLAPAILRRVRPEMAEGEQPRYELMVSATAVAAQVSALQLSSADALFAMCAGVIAGGRQFLVEAASGSEVHGSAYAYRLLLREAFREQLVL